MSISECINTLATFAETVQVIECLGNYFYKTYSSQYLDNNHKDRPSDAWTANSSQIYINTKNDLQTRGSTSSLSSTSIDTNILDCQTPDILDSSPRNEEVPLAENDRLVYSDEDSYHSCSLLDSNNTTSSNIIATNKSVLHEPLNDTSNEIHKLKDNSFIKTTNFINSDTAIAGVEKENGFQIDKFLEYNKNIPERDKNKKEIYGIKKLTTSSWDLEAITEYLYSLPEPKISKVLPEVKSSTKDILVKSQGAFCKYPEGNYTLELQKQSVVVKQETNILVKMLLNYAEISTNGNILQLDNKVGRCLYLKCASKEELLELKQELEAYCFKCWSSEQINLVHYPLKYHQNVVIIDLGSCSTRAGILMDQATLPFIFFPSVCAINKVTGNHIYGKEALQNDVRQNSNLSFPIRPSVKIIKHSIDIGLVEGLFKKIFQDLKVDPSQYTIQVCLPRNLSIHDQNSLVKLLLEDLKVKAVSLTHQALLTLYAHNVSTGIVVDIGDRMDILPVVDGFIVENGVTRLPHGGQRLIHHMKHALAEKHISLSNDIDSFVVQFISENLSYIAEDYESEIQIAKQNPDIVKKSVALNSFTKDVDCIQEAVLDDARFKIPEGLFKPTLWGLDNPGLHKLTQKAIQATGVDVRKKIAENIYVSGGITMIPGFVERLLKELSNLNKPRITPKIIASRYRYHCTYIGACKFARMEVFPRVCVNAEEYSKEQLASLKRFVLCF
ncbi:actin, non-muscle 6.2 [Caerostris darwini]|uniref:Actin, non-muscle 6.2 n=1 Tax=Caerostris darwini TaxID=1538125 RepID=A0AAV4W2V9_9ARAC|nr:actin, non-muscle 6.2 [Caerostris darwini]